MDHSAETLQWDIFCKVIDNFGDIGVCWRLSADLASRGHRVRLWVDDASALVWMAPEGCAGVAVLTWQSPLAQPHLQLLDTSRTDVLVEAFGCEIPGEFLAACVQRTRPSAHPPVWINLEYLTAEPYAERSHGLPSPVNSGPAAGWTKWFFYPGFTSRTGGLLREPGLTLRQQQFDRSAWLADHGIDWQGKALISLFCYEPPALAVLLQELDSRGLNGRPVRLLVAAGRAQEAVRAAQASGALLPGNVNPRLEITFLPLMSQSDFDHLLWACDLNFVRGEDSIIRAIWAGKPFVWQIYPQHDGAHQAKLDAFLDMLDAPPSLREVHRDWNDGTAKGPGHRLDLDLQSWQTMAGTARTRLAALPDLGSRLLEFVHKNR
ncbi:MAG: elongation factor P maturation arginine rhamnosyltransferase EarP [Pseudomonadota bacterium]